MCSYRDDWYFITYTFQSVCLPVPYFYLLFVISAFILKFLFMLFTTTVVKLQKTIKKYNAQQDIKNNRNSNSCKQENKQDQINDTSNIHQANISDSPGGSSYV